MKTTVLNLEAHDDLISIRDKLAWAKSPRILLVWPMRRLRRVEAPLELSRLDLTLLVRHARKQGAQLALVTANPRVRAYAAEAGVAVFDTTEEAQEASWRRIRRRRLSQIRHAHRLQDKSADEKKHPISWREQRMQFAPPKAPDWMRSPAGRIGVFLVGVLAVLSIVLLFVPGAKISLNMVKQNQQVRLEIWASPGVTQASVTGALPARLESVVVEGQQQIVASGSVLIPEAYAGGQVLFTNLSQSAVTLPEGTILRTIEEEQDVRRFELLADVNLPAQVGATAQGRVQALLPGLDGNVPANAIQSVEGSLGSLVSVSNPQAIRGGSQRRVPAPTDEDFEVLRDQTIEILSQTAIQEISGRLPEGSLLVEDSLLIEQVELEERIPPKGGAADRLILTLRIRFTVWIVRQEDILKVAQMALEATMPEGYQAAWAEPEIIVENDFTLQDQRVTAVLKASWAVEPAVASVDIARAVLGKSPQEAQQVLQAMLVLQEQPAIELNPAWWPVLPLLPSEIQVIRN